MKRIISWLVQFLFGIISRTKIEGLDKILTSEPAILTGNHIGILDGIMIPSIPLLANHPNLVVVVAEKYEDNAILRWGVKHLNFMFIDRFNPDIATLRRVIRKIEANGLMVISPEGTRSKNAQLIEGKPGTAYLAAKTGAKIIPFGATGTADHEVKSRLKRFRRLDVLINIGEPYTIPPLPSADREIFLQKYTDEIMCQIAALLPLEYRGVYADHPRTLELLQQS
jgi:1-acyl-sn-glycerol-3-phosphate acyltransferase